MSKHSSNREHLLPKDGNSSRPLGEKAISNVQRMMHEQSESAEDTIDISKLEPSVRRYVLGLQKKLEWALKSPISGVKNLNGFQESVKEIYPSSEVKHERRTGIESSDFITVIAYLDTENLKMINDTLGHNQGDAYIRATAESAKECIRESDLLGHEGGDEFIVVFRLPKKMSEEEIELFIKNKKIEFKKAFEEKSISVSIGFSFKRNAYAEDVIDKESELRQEAERQMYDDKLQSGKGR